MHFFGNVNKKFKPSRQTKHSFSPRLLNIQVFKQTVYIVSEFHPLCLGTPLVPEGMKSQIYHFCISNRGLDSLVLPYYNVIKIKWLLLKNLIPLS